MSDKIAVAPCSWGIEMQIILKIHTGVLFWKKRLLPLIQELSWALTVIFRLLPELLMRN